MKRWQISGIGMEWIVPAILAIAITFGSGYLMGIPFLYQAIFLAATLSWAYIFFGYMHDALHIKGFWMLENIFLKNWFLDIRKLHDIHHFELTDDGRMNKNYGICFFWFDKIFGSFAPKGKAFNEKGFEASQERYAYILKSR